MVLFMFLALMYGAVQLFLLSSLSRTTSWRTILFGFVAGMSAGASAAILLERGSALLFAAALHRPLSSVPQFDSYTSDPIIEEFCKVLPLLLVLLISRVRTRLGFSDIVVICAAIGSGFGFTEITLRFGSGAAGAHWSNGYWLISEGFSSIGIPGIGVILRSWLPAGLTSVGLFARPAMALNTHMIWSAIVGLAIGIAFRAPWKWKWTALLLFVFACLDHATSNAAQLHVRFPFMLSSAFAAMRHFTAFYALVPLAVGFWLDRLALRRGLADEPELKLPAAGQGKLGTITLAAGYLRTPVLLRALWSYVLQRRAFAYCKALKPSDESLPSERARLVAFGARLEQLMAQPAAATSSSPSPSPAAHHLNWPRTLRIILFLIVAIPPLLYFVIGDFPSTAKLQNAFAQITVFHTLVCLLGACLLLQSVSLAGQGLTFWFMRNKESPQAVLLHGLSITTAAGALLFSTISILVLPHHKPLQQLGQFPDALLNFALSHPLIVIGIILAEGTLLLFLPELILASFSTAPVTIPVEAVAPIAGGGILQSISSIAPYVLLPVMGLQYVQQFEKLVFPPPLPPSPLPPATYTMDPNGHLTTPYSLRTTPPPGAPDPPDAPELDMPAKNEWDEMTGGGEEDPFEIL